MASSVRSPLESSCCNLGRVLCRKSLLKSADLLQIRPGIGPQARWWPSRRLEWRGNERVRMPSVCLLQAWERFMLRP